MSLRPSAARPTPPPEAAIGLVARARAAGRTRDRRVLACAAVAVLLHLLVLGPVAGEVSKRPRVGDPGHTTLRSVQLAPAGLAVTQPPAVALVDASAAHTRASVDASATPDDAERPAATGGPASTDPTMVAPAALASAVPTSAAPADATRALDSPTPGTAAPSNPSSSDDAGLQGYLPRRQLSRAPLPLAEVHIDYPAGTPVGQFSGELVVFVDEAGRVRQVRARDSRLPPGLEDAARQAFHATPFAPGELDGQPVRAMYPVQVTFSVDLPVLARQP